MKAKRVGDSLAVFSYLMLPQDANPAGNVHGGVVMKHIDSAAGVVAARHARTFVVTASIDRLDFHSPVYIGNLLTLKAAVNIVGRTSMEVGVRVEAEDLRTGEVRHTASAYLTLVAMGQNGRPVEVPPLIIETEEEKRRNRESAARRKTRLAEKRREQECQRDLESCEL
jgi:acyl-CoA hydrolase